MIAVDTSSLVAFFQGELSVDVEAIERSISEETLIVPPFVVTEIFSAKNLSTEAKLVVDSLPTRTLDVSFWKRSGLLRLKLLKLGLKARSIDSLIAQFCLDNKLTLICGDRDFRHLSEHTGLNLLIES
ncbi:MAG: PIN domain-containing protein [Opitutales bacterium]|nr:PIN domain-containing protein [Opitutales bacterium]